MATSRRSIAGERATHVRRGGGHEGVPGTRREAIIPGQTVEIVLKQDQRTGRRTRGVVKEILTRSPTHPHGIKVRLTGGAVGRVKEILDVTG